MRTRILIADPNRFWRNLYREYLPEARFEITTADSGLTCLDALEEMVPDVLVIDWELPWGGAEGVLEYLREAERRQNWRDIPVLITGKIVSFTQLERLDRLVHPPVVKFLAKPFDRANLAGSISLALGKCRTKNSQEGIMQMT